MMLSRVHILALTLKIMILILNLKLEILWEYQKIKTVLQKATLHIGQKKKFFFENTVPWTNVIEECNSEETAGMIFEKELQKTNQTEFRI